jgi:hypothetical protein
LILLLSPNPVTRYKIALTRLSSCAQTCTQSSASEKFLGGAGALAQDVVAAHDHEGYQDLANDVEDSVGADLLLGKDKSAKSRVRDGGTGRRHATQGSVTSAW